MRSLLIVVAQPSDQIGGAAGCGFEIGTIALPSGATDSLAAVAALEARGMRTTRVQPSQPHLELVQPDLCHATGARRKHSAGLGRH
jgi:hypothetical protein